ncbi:MAG: hypothetical protein ACK4MF_09995, partial [Hyphomicrobiaceae bacterium]
MNSAIPATVLAKFDVFDWRNAQLILQGAHPEQWKELIGALSDFRLPWAQLAAKGKNKTESA